MSLLLWFFLLRMIIGREGKRKKEKGKREKGNKGDGRYDNWEKLIWEVQNLILLHFHFGMNK